MSDAKTEYSNSVYSKKNESFLSPELLKEIKKGRKRRNEFRQNWEPVDLNEFVNKFTPDYTKEFHNGKLYFVSKDKKLAVVADLGGTYCKLMDYTTEGAKHPKYLDINGRDPHLYKGKDGKMHARTRPEIEIATHFRIKYRSEMKKNLPLIIK